jgi:hypothetical protein
LVIRTELWLGSSRTLRAVGRPFHRVWRNFSFIARTCLIGGRAIGVRRFYIEPSPCPIQGIRQVGKEDAFCLVSAPRIMSKRLIMAGNGTFAFACRATRVGSAFFFSASGSHWRRSKLPPDRHAADRRAFGLMCRDAMISGDAVAFYHGKSRSESDQVRIRSTEPMRARVATHRIRATTRSDWQ